VLCNVLVCLAVWLCFAARNVASKILAIVFPITAFVALGFEHSIANMYFIPIGIMATGDAAMAGPVVAAGAGVANLNLAGFIGNLVPVTLGNIVGGGVFVALVYYVVYLRGETGQP
jgi:formate/nitrite transporter FocA (FNT family)